MTWIVIGIVLVMAWPAYAQETFAVPELTDDRATGPRATVKRLQPDDLARLKRPTRSLRPRTRRPEMSIKHPGGGKPAPQGDHPGKTPNQTGLAGRTKRSSEGARGAPCIQQMHRVSPGRVVIRCKGQPPQSTSKNTSRIGDQP
ncbi:MAG: hypothetical protein AAF732_20535 [Pseudomonadota bacterium]